MTERLLKVFQIFYVVSTWSIFFCLIVTLSHSDLTSQGENNHWYLPGGITFDFNFDTLIQRYNRISPLWDPFGEFIESISTVSSSSGELLLYYGANTIRNKNNQIIDNGSEIRGHFSMSQGAVFVPIIRDSIYYLFTTHVREDLVREVYYSIIRKGSHWTGWYIRPNERTLFLESHVSEGMISLKGYCNETWLLLHGVSDKFYAYKIKDGHISEAVVSSVGKSHEKPFMHMAWHEASNTIALSDFWNKTNSVELFSFDRLTGDLQFKADLETEDDLSAPIAASFSPNGKYLYIGCFVQDFAQVQQWDISDLSEFSHSTVYQYEFRAINSSPTVGLGPDNKIYFFGYEGEEYGVIHNPDAQASELIVELKLPRFSLTKFLGTAIQNNVVSHETLDTIQNQIDLISDPCITPLTISYNDSSALRYQWYQSDSLMNEQIEPSLILNDIDNNPYFIEVLDNDLTCKVYGPYAYSPTVVLLNDTLKICRGDTITYLDTMIYQPSDYIFDISHQDNTCDTMITLAVQWYDQGIVDTLVVNTSENNYLWNGIYYTVPGIYSDTLVSEGGCDSLVTLMLNKDDVSISDTNKFIVPNVFSPNGDGLNDDFEIHWNENFSMLTFRLFNRWGAEIIIDHWEDSQMTGNVWSIKSSQFEELRSGVYVYQIEYLGSNGQPMFFCSDVTVVR